MIVGVTVCHKDINQFWRWMKWTSTMRSYHTPLGYDHTLYVMANQRIQPEIDDIMEVCSGYGLWKKVRFKRCETEDERGWPASPTHLFINLLEWVEKETADDLLFCEPDTTPLSPDWIDLLQSEFEEGGKPFMGVEVRTMDDGIKMGFNDFHMSGVGIYGKDWRNAAPALADVLEASCEGALFPTGHAWDLFAGHQTVPNMHRTQKIQHTWRPKFVSKLSLPIVKPETILFHQTKDQALMKLWDEVHYGGKIFGEGSDLIQPIKIAPSFYHTEVASKPFKIAQGEYLPWKKVGPSIGGVQAGVLRVIDPANAIFLDFEATQKKGIRKITAEEFEVLTRK